MDTNSVQLLFANNTKKHIEEVWVGHRTSDTKQPPEIFFSAKDQPDNARIIGDITLVKSTSDHWLVYWRDEDDVLWGVPAQWFPAKADLKSTYIWVIVSGSGDATKVDVQQQNEGKRKLIGTQVARRLTFDTNPLVAALWRPPLTVDGVIARTRAPKPSTPGNVGVCLSGGGSRALSAGMGQLRALQHLTLHGKSLLSQAKAISTVSGGSWLGVTYSYLQGTSDEDFLGGYVADPSKLRWDGPSAPTSLGYQPPGNAGSICSGPGFNGATLLIEAVLLRWAGLPGHMIWQTVMGLHVLKPHGLHQHDKLGMPTAAFSYDAQTWNGICKLNASLEDAQVNLVASESGARARRPYVICNMAMVVRKDGKQWYAPAQATPLLTGVIGDPDATTGNGVAVGGGGVDSFAFNSTVGVVGQRDTVHVNQGRQFTLTDVVGVSSAAAASVVVAIMSWLEPEELPRLFALHGDAAFNRVRDVIPEGRRAEVETLYRNVAASPAPWIVKFIWNMINDFVKEMALVPAYFYWPVSKPNPADAIEATAFIDAGMLENTGIGGMLAYGDIESIITFVNSAEPLRQAARGIRGPGGVDLPGTSVYVEAQIPPLFGFQPYDEQTGYVPYREGSSALNYWYQKAQVFDEKDFADLLRNLWAKSEGGARPATHRQTLTTVDNPWFGVKARTVKVLWSYLTPVSDFTTALDPGVQRHLHEDLPSFPNYPTTATQLSPEAVNLLASLTAWCVAADENKGEYLSLFNG